MIGRLTSLWREHRGKSTEEKIASQIKQLPSSLIGAIGGGDFIQVGEVFVERLRQQGLEPDDVVLDAGCGLARIAIPLQRYLTRGEYDGFDIVPEYIEWNRKHISAVSSHFKFKRLDLSNSMYNPQGSALAAQATFPYPDDRFTFVFATSLFTHLLDDETLRYFSEMARVMKPGATAVLTFFLLDEFARQQVAKHQTFPTFDYEWRRGFLHDPDDRAQAVAYDAEWLLERMRESGLEPVEVLHGGWSGRQPHVDYQDIVIAKRR